MSCKIENKSNPDVGRYGYFLFSGIKDNSCSICKNRTYTLASIVWQSLLPVLQACARWFRGWEHGWRSSHDETLPDSFLRFAGIACCWRLASQGEGLTWPLEGKPDLLQNSWFGLKLCPQLDRGAIERCRRPACPPPLPPPTPPSPIVAWRKVWNGLGLIFGRHLASSS